MPRWIGADCSRFPPAPSCFRNPNVNKAPFHLGVTLKQGSRTLLDRKLCAWYQSSFLVADRAGISCWW